MNRLQPTVVDEPELQRALDCGELIRLYQPVFDLRTGALAQVEALLRWDHPHRGLLAPGEFLVGEDDSTLLVRIGWSVVIEAARRAGAWREAFPERPVTVSVNVFDAHLERKDLPGRVAHLLYDNEIQGPGALVFEIGEHHFRRPRTRERDRLSVLQNLDVAVVVDDFGVSAAAELGPDELRDWSIEQLDYYRGFPVDGVKVDPGCAAKLATTTRLRAVVDAAHDAGLVVTALAVEDEHMATRAHEADCDLAQGFYFARPERPSRIDELLALR
jgi:EAL domain-containing protein (putative c-di-GMP-specific phosphodiesterase class I)